MDLCLLGIGKISTPWINEGIANYTARIGKYVKFSDVYLPDPKIGKSFSKDIQKEEEGKLILHQLLPSDHVVIFDEKGAEKTSREFANWIQKNLNSGKKRLVFIIGGPYGFSENIYRRTNEKLALSKMTFTHEMAKLLAAEQIYRAMTILRGEPYHHD